MIQRLRDRIAGFFRGSSKPEPLRGARPVRREKTYSADTGYVYQYYYEGYREGRRGDQAGYEHVFSVTSDRTSRFPVKVFLSHQAVERWQLASGRELAVTEQYAVVKMSLFQAFDERRDLSGGSAEVMISEADIQEHAATLDL